MLKTAAVNEPRFEKEGLLIEGQSTNMVVQSEILPRMLEAGSYTVTTSVVQGYNLHSCVYNSGDDALVVDTWATLQAADGTGSFVFNSATIVGNWSCYFNNTDSYVGFWPKNSSAFEYEDLGKGLIRASRKLKGTTLNIIHLRCGKVPGSRIDIGCYQIEALPFASSYIPTNGAAVTRAADVCFIPERQNIYSGGTDVSFCCEVDTKGGSTRIFEAGDATLFYINEKEFGGRVSRFATKTIANSYILGSRAIVAASISPARVTSRLNGIVVSGVPAIEGSAGFARLQFGNRSATLDRPLNGHIRNFRIWHSALTDEQIKALK